VQQLGPLRQVYADLTEFAPIWEAFDKIEGRGVVIVGIYLNCVLLDCVGLQIAVASGGH